MQEFHGQQWVVRRYLASAVDIIKQTKQTVEQHTNAHAGQEFCQKTGAGIRTGWGPGTLWANPQLEEKIHGKNP